jgi:zinc finger protein
VRTCVPGPCPVCNTEIEYLYQTDNIPYFSDIIIITASCRACGYRFTDTQVLGEHEPGRLEFAVETPEDMVVRVVRSMKGVVLLPELGVRIDPGPACEGFVTNIEGVLERVANVVRGVLSCGDEAESERASVILEQIELAKEGRYPVTLIIDDPSGNSAIVSEKTKTLPIPETDCDDSGE